MADSEPDIREQIETGIRAYLSLIWFAIWSSIAHALVMTWQSFAQPVHKGHLVGDVPALLLVAAALALLTSRAQKARAAAAA